MYWLGVAIVHDLKTQITTMDPKAAWTHSSDQWISNAFKSLLAFLDANKILIGIVLIIAVFRHEAPSKPHTAHRMSDICIERNLTRFDESRDYDGLRKMAYACGKSGLADRAGAILRYWDNEDWRQAKAEQTVRACQRYIDRWEADGSFVEEARFMIRSLKAREQDHPAAGRDYCAAQEPSSFHGGERAFFVQVFSSRTLDRAASARDVIARRYAEVLGSCDLDVHSLRRRQEGDLHRVLIGPIQTKFTAQTLCNTLRQKGLDECAAIQ